MSMRNEPENDWRNQAQCLGTDMQPEAASPAELGRLLEVCAGCPVRRECTSLARNHPHSYGVHGAKWYGEPPANPERFECGWCGELAPVGASYCVNRCRTAAHRAKALSA